MFSQSKLEFMFSLSLLTWTLLIAYSKATATEHCPVSYHSEHKTHQTNVCYPDFYYTFRLTFALT